MNTFLTQLAKQVVALNDARLDGHIDRATHALAIAEINEALTRNGYTWNDLSAVAA